MSTPNFETQRDFDLYVTNNFLVYPYELDENDDFVLDDKGEPIICEDADPYFDNEYFELCEEYTDNNLNSKLRFFAISLKSGYYQGIQTYIEPKYHNDFDAFDYLEYPQYYDPKELFAQFGYNTYILKRKILAEIKLINNTLLPKLKDTFCFDKIKCVGIFSNGEAIYKKA
jgi:hypothetical protein